LIALKQLARHGVDEHGRMTQDEVMSILSARDVMPREGGPSFSLSHRVFRLLWNTTWLLLASWTPPMLHAWRRNLLRLFGAKIDPTAVIYGSARIWFPPNLEMGPHACLGPRVNCYAMAKIRLEQYALVSQGAHLCAGSHDIDDAHFQLIARSITIGANAWIAAEAFVGPGVTVGEGAVLGARGVAFRDLPPWTVYVGNPARQIRRRNNRLHVKGK
jgi:putative colanic acid biosynthesis acetyltransferase WcaF